jgi:hypothetical protein
MYEFVKGVSVKSENWEKHLNVSKNSTFWVITPLIQFKVNRRFGGICRLYLQGRRISRGRKRVQVTGFSLGPFLDPELIPPKHWLTFNRLNSVIPYKIEFFKTTAEGTSNSTSQSLLFRPSVLKLSVILFNVL